MQIKKGDKSTCRGIIIF